MATLIIPVGCSGCGKSTFYSHLKNTVSVEPDGIRRERGDVNNQKDGHIVFGIAYRRAKKALDDGQNVYFDATNLTLKAIKDVIKNTGATDVKIVLFNDSEDWKECQRRVKSDIEAGKDRSNTHGVLIDGKPLQQIMSEKFIALKANSDFWKYCNENNIEVLEA